MRLLRRLKRDPQSNWLAVSTTCSQILLYGDVKMGRRIVNNLLSKLDIHPVLIDIGASGARSEIWEGIARHSIYVGFDSDDRDLQEVRNGRI